MAVGRSMIAVRRLFSTPVAAPMIFLVLATACLALSAAPASATTDADALGQFSSQGTAAGQLEFPKGSDADPATGHLYVTGSDNRIDEFTPWGGFVKAFGWDVAPGTINEQQEVRVRAAGGHFKLSFGASTTPDLAFDAPGRASEGPESVEAALNALPSIGAGGGSVSVEEVAGNPDGTTPYIYVISFKGSLAATDVAQLAAANGATPLSGGSPSTSLEARTRADGGAATTGLEVCTRESGCKAGLAGSGAGQLDGTFSVAVDSDGDVYVRDLNNRRVQKFSPAGRFLLMFGGEVDKTEVQRREEQEAHAEPVTVTEAEENICTAASHHVCGVGTSGAGAGQFSGGLDLAIGPTGSVFVGDSGRIQSFSPEGDFLSEIPVAGNIRHLAIDPDDGELYVDYESGVSGTLTKEDVRKLNPLTGAEVATLPVGKPDSLSTDSAGNVYVVDDEVAGGPVEDRHPERVLEFDPAGNQISSFGIPDFLPDNTGNRFGLEGLGTNALGDLYVSNARSGVDSFMSIFGPPPVQFESPPKTPPVIVAQYAASVDTGSAELRAQINPEFWSDTRYYLEYGTSPCASGGCSKQPIPPGAKLTSSVTSSPITTAGILLDGLLPGTTYHYRFVAQSSGGGPVAGLSGKSGEEAEASFTTLRPSAPEVCPGNEAFRGGPSALLPDCRAYEMVSPLEKGNGDIRALGETLTSLPAVLNQSATSGERLAYGSYRAFGDAESAPFTTQYIAARGPTGWSTHAISAPQGAVIPEAPNRIDTELRAFSPDLCVAWLRTIAEAPLSDDAVKGYPNLYRRQDEECGGSKYEALTTVKPPNVEGKKYGLELQGLSADGSHAIFRAGDKLTPEASASQSQLYEETGTHLRFVCILPTGEASSVPCTAGGTPTPGDGKSRRANVTNAISADGSRIFWTASDGAGKIYVRIGGTETVAVSKTAEALSGTTGSRYWTAADDGSRVIFSTGADLYEFVVATKATHLIAHATVGAPLGASQDASRIYFVSTSSLVAGGTKGQPNLYLYDTGKSGGSFTFIATLSTADAEAHPTKGPTSPIADEPWQHSSRVSPDGLHAAFMSSASLTGYDNIDAVSGEADTEVYLYDAPVGSTPGKLVCASCNPTGARPAGTDLGSRSGASFWTAAQLPVWENTLYAARVLSNDGGRLFFESSDALVARDTNEKIDVYEWEAAGVGGCNAGDPSFAAESDGCLGLISSGQSGRDSEFIDASPNGDDVFIATLSSLLSQDYGLIDIYDARVGGGFPEPPPVPVECEGEACQHPLPPPQEPTPSSFSYVGPGNSKKRICSKGKVRRGGHCVKKHRGRRLKNDKKHGQGAAR